MKILVYGVGAIGALMVHYLCRAGNDVTVVARSTYDELKNNGLVIVNALDKKKMTVDHPNVVREADYNVKYDIVFSVMQAQQQEGVLDALSKVNTKLIVMVGNDPECESYESYIKEHAVSKRLVLFGFQNSAGHRENGKAYCLLLPVTELVIGGIHSAADPRALAIVKRAFDVKGYKITPVDDMYAYYMYHIGSLLPYCLMSYKVGHDLKKLGIGDIKLIVKATKEAFDFLKSTGIKAMPPKEDEFYSGGIKGFAMFTLYLIMAKTKLGIICIADHCRNAVGEMRYIDEEFEKYRSVHKGTPMPTWDRMRKYLP